MKVADLDYPLPQEAIAQRPADQRDHSRLFVLHSNGRREHRNFRNIVEYLRPGDMLLLNDTKVLPARLVGKKRAGGKIDVLLVHRTGNDGVWEVLCRDRYEGVIIIGDDVVAETWREAHSTSRGAEDRGVMPRRLLRFLECRLGNDFDIIGKFGAMPLPPYIRRQPDEEDRHRYQTVYASKDGSIAAPTAGLHFTRELLSMIMDHGVLVRTVTLHVGVGTFRPVVSQMVKDHHMDAEFFEVRRVLIEEIQQVKASGGRLITVGTTATRCIEAVVGNRYMGSGVDSSNEVIRGYTDLFITPGYSFKAADGLVTNFHLPRSTPLMLAAAAAGLGQLLDAYREALANDYRFFSYGDAMLIL